MQSEIATFEKVSLEQFIDDCKYTGFWYGGSNDWIRKRWEDIRLPARATSGSAGYDFFMPFEFVQVGERATTIPTGVRCRIEEGWCLCLLPRSGLGFRYGMRLENTLGLIDSDYYGAKNEGHILVCLSSGQRCKLMHGDRYVQGVFLPFGLADGDGARKTREGGMGSTGS